MAQDPAVATDPRAAAAALATAGDQDVAAAIPSDFRAAMARLAASLDAEERTLALDEGEDGNLAALAAACALLQQPRAEPSTAAALLREARAARRLDNHAASRRNLANLVGSGADPWAAVREPADRRCRAAVAALLRDHADAAETDLGLLLHGTHPAIRPLLAAREARLATTPRAIDRLAFLVWLRREGRVDAARQILQSLPEATAPRLLVQAEQLAVAGLEQREILAEMAALQATAEGDSAAAKVGRLRLLQLTDANAALAESKALVAADFPHAAPSTLLATAAFLSGARGEADAALQRALAKPGADTWAAQLLVMVQLLALRDTRQPNTAPPDVDLTALQDSLRRADALAATDQRVAGKLFRGLRDLGWPLEREGRAMFEDLAGVRELAQALPELPAVQRMLLAAVLFTDDAAAAREALQAKPSATLAGLPGLVRQRAEVAVSLAVRMDDAAARRAFVEPFLQALEALPGGAVDGHLLRGMLAWSEATTGTDAAARERAVAHFAKAGRAPFDRGAWQVAAATWVASAVAGSDVDNTALLRVRTLSRADDAAEQLVPVVATYALHGDDPEAFDQARRLLGQLRDAPAQAMVLHAALADGLARTGDRAGARAAAKQALALRPAAALLQPFVDRGLLPIRQLQWALGANARGPELQMRLRLEFFALPALPGADRLRQLAAD